MKKNYFLNFEIFACSVFLLIFANSFGQIYNNGPFSTGATSTGGTAAPTGYTWSELQTPATSYGISGFYFTSMTSDFSVADDFVVPTGATWNITGAAFFGYQTGFAGTTIPINNLRVRIWNGDPSLVTSTVVYGNMTTSVLDATASGDGLVYRTLGSPTGTTRKVWRFNAAFTVSLPAGTYWIEYQAHATNDGSVFFPPVTILNTFTNPAWNAKQRNGATWAAVTDAGSTFAVAAPFQLFGTITLGVSENEFSSKVSLYPNPAKNSLTVSDASKSTDATIEITDISGRIVKSVKAGFSNDVIINVSDLTSGNYILKLKSEKGTAIKKFIKI